MSDDIIKVAPFKLLTTHNSTEDQLRLYMMGKLPRTMISPALEKKRQEIKICDDLIRKYGNHSKVCDFLMETHGMSYGKATKLFEKTQRILGSAITHDQKYWVDILIGGIVDDISKAKIKQDYRSVASLRKTMMDAIERLLGSADAALYEKIQPVVPVLGHWPEQLKTGVPTDPVELKKLIEKFRNAKKKKAIDSLSTDIEFNEVRK